MIKWWWGNHGWDWTSIRLPASFLLTKRVSTDPCYWCVRSTEGECGSRHSDHSNVTPDAPSLFCHFNQCTVGRSLADVCYGSIKEPNKSFCGALCGMFDWNVFYLVPIMKSVLKRTKPQCWFWCGQRVHPDPSRLFFLDWLGLISKCLCDLDKFTDCDSEYSFLWGPHNPKRVICICPNDKLWKILLIINAWVSEFLRFGRNLLLCLNL